MKSFRMVPGAALCFIQGVIGCEWIQSGRDKLTDGNFISGMPKTVAAFASNNSHSWYQSFLTGTVASNATLFGSLVAWGEFLTGIALVLTALYWLVGRFGKPILVRTSLALGGLAALIAALMSANFYFAAGWMNVSTDGLNTVMFWAEIVLAAAVLYTLVQIRSKNKVIPLSEVKPSQVA